MATTVHEAGRRIALDEIRVPENVRSLDDLHVQALAGSIALQGMLGIDYGDYRDPQARASVAVEVHRRRQDPRPALWACAGRHRRGAARHAARRAVKPADARHPLELA